VAYCGSSPWRRGCKVQHAARTPDHNIIALNSMSRCHLCSFFIVVHCIVVSLINHADCLPFLWPVPTSVLISPSYLDRPPSIGACAHPRGTAHRAPLSRDPLWPRFCFSRPRFERPGKNGQKHVEATIARRKTRRGRGAIMLQAAVVLYSREMLIVAR